MGEILRSVIEKIPGRRISKGEHYTRRQHEKVLRAKEASEDAVAEPVKEMPQVSGQEHDQNNTELHQSLAQDHYFFRRKLWDTKGKGWKGLLKSSVEQTFHGQDANGNVLLSVRQKGFKSREDIRVYADIQQTQELLSIKNEGISDFSGKFNVRDTVNGETVGALKRKGWKSTFRDEWIILSPKGEEIGTVKEKSKYGSAYLKRGFSQAKDLVGAIPLVGAVSELIPSAYVFSPQKFSIADKNGEEIADIEHSRRLGFNLTMDIKQKEPSIDRRLLTTASILLCAIEGRQR